VKSQARTPPGGGPPLRDKAILSGRSAWRVVRSAAAVGAETDEPVARLGGPRELAGSPWRWPRGSRVREVAREHPAAIQDVPGAPGLAGAGENSPLWWVTGGVTLMGWAVVARVVFVFPRGVIVRGVAGLAWVGAGCGVAVCGVCGGGFGGAFRGCAGGVGVVA